MQLSMRSNVFLLFVAILVLVDVPKAASRHEYNFSACGGAQLCLGASKLERLRRRSGLVTKTIQQLAKELDDDEDMGVDTTNDLLVVSCAGLIAPPPPPNTKTGSSSSSSKVSELRRQQHHHHRSLKGGFIPTPADAEIVSGWLPSMQDTAITLAETFRLHSRPNATLKIMLDFDGHTTTGTAWNVQANKPTIVTPPYDKDGKPNSFSADELSDMLAIWRAVSEDYSPWDVDVTTEDPGAAYLTANGIRVAIGGAYTDWYGSSAGGVAYVGVFGKYNGYYSPAFIFPKNLGNFYAKYVYEASSHECGHTLSLSHDGQAAGNGITGTAYYAGHGDWAPIMGVSYYKSVTQWSKGEYRQANNQQDQIALISSFLGPVTAIPQQHGNSTATAAILVGAPDAGGNTATARAGGIIRQPSDVEVFAIQTNATGNVTVQLLGAPAWGSVLRSNLNASVTVQSMQGAVLGQASGVGVIAFSLPSVVAGTYFIFVRPTAAGNPLTTGYSTYGCQGQYELVVTYPLVDQTGGLFMMTAPSPEPSPFPVSPSPAVSPSPSPPVVVSPSPSPLPAANVMNISSIAISKTTNNKVTCKAIVTVVLSCNGTKVARAAVSGTWSSSPAGVSGWPIAASSTNTGASGTSLGIVTFTSSRTLPATTGYGCSFTVTSWSKSSMVQDASAVLGPVALKW